ncbi:MAG: 2-oxoacid:acceptor oxidoreductase subunit alpha [Candidatus Anstonellales archaeon]
MNKDEKSRITTPLNDVTIKIGGEAGSGVATIGLTLARCLKDLGFYIFSENDYPSLIRGGHNTQTVRACTRRVHSLLGPVHLLLCLNKNSAIFHRDEVVEGGAIIYDGESFELNSEEKRDDVSYISVPLSRIAKEQGDPVYENSAAIGAGMCLLGGSIDIVEAQLNKMFETKKSEEIALKNITAAKEGFQYVSNLGKSGSLQIEIREKIRGQLLLNGNEAICLGALRGGCKFVAEYPMSPSSSILHLMAKYEREFGLVVKHTEDEIAAINMICGSAFAGARALTATSGGGFSLMVEALGMAGISEQPIVIVEVQRCGPSTGLPTYTEQADLQFVLHASQGEFPRLVFCPGDVEECFYGTVDVMNLAEKLQVPAIILSDKYLAEQYATVNRFDVNRACVDRGKIMTDEQMKNFRHWMDERFESKSDASYPVFKRHVFTEDGISPRCFPGQENGMHVASSYEHDETGFTSEDPQMRVAMIDKRARKLASVPQSLIRPKIYGDPNAEFLLIAWGSTKGPCLEALKLLQDQGFKIKFMHISWACPFDSLSVLNELQRSRKQLICEGNSEAQMRSLIREKTGFFIKNVFLKYDGRPFDPIAIADEIKRLY